MARSGLPSVACLDKRMHQGAHVQVARSYRPWGNACGDHTIVATRARLSGVYRGLKCELEHHFI